MEYAIKICGLAEVRRKLIGKLSKGYRQRVGIAQAILADPEVLILDEPTVGLDPRQVVEIRELIRSLAGRSTVLLSTHILPEVTMTCRRIVIIDKGRIVAQDTPEKLTAKLQGNEQSIITVAGPKDSGATNGAERRRAACRGLRIASATRRKTASAASSRSRAGRAIRFAARWRRRSSNTDGVCSKSSRSRSAWKTFSCASSPARSARMRTSRIQYKFLR